MTSLRARIEKKQRRRLVVPIQASDPSKDHEAYLGVAAALQLAQSKDDTSAEYVAQLEKQLTDAGERYRGHFVEIEMQALSRDDWEAAMHRWQGEETIDWGAALAPLLAESCTDVDLQDEAWWVVQLSKPEWTEGDTDSLRMAILTLNVEALEARYPKD